MSTLTSVDLEGLRLKTSAPHRLPVSYKSQSRPRRLSVEAYLTAMSLFAVLACSRSMEASSCKQGRVFKLE
jgi:hypothetical protein